MCYIRHDGSCQKSEVNVPWNILLSLLRTKQGVDNQGKKMSDAVQAKAPHEIAQIRPKPVEELGKPLKLYLFMVSRGH